MTTPITDEDLARFREIRSKTSFALRAPTAKFTISTAADSDFIIEAANNWDALLDEIAAQRNELAQYKVQDLYVDCVGPDGKGCQIQYPGYFVCKVCNGGPYVPFRPKEPKPTGETE